MRAGEFPNGARVLRAKIDMASPNLNLRDPVLYRIVHAAHPRTGDAWCIYPTYDFAHGQSDAIEGVTHSICTLEFENHRPLYDWLIENLPVPSRPHQYEFARLNLTYTVLSKRVLLQPGQRDGHVRGWDDPRMPTISGLRRRGFPAEGIRRFATEVGVARNDSVIEIGVLEHAVRDVLNRTAPRRFGVLDPLKVVIENYPEGQVEELEAINNPEDPSAGTRRVPFSRELYIEADDFREEPPPKFFRLARGARCACAPPTSSPAPGWSRTTPARSWSCAARTTRPPAAAMRRMGDGQRPRCTGSPRRRPCRPRSASTTTSSPDRIREPMATCSRISRRPRRSSSTATSSPPSPMRRWGRPSSSSASATSAPIRTRARAPGLQSDPDPQGHLGEGPGPPGRLISEPLVGWMPRWRVAQR